MGTMGRLSLPCLLLALSGAAYGRTTQDDIRLFQDYKLTYGRKYTGSEEAHRFACFTKMLNLIDERNAAPSLEFHVVNQFTDLCPEEFASIYLRNRIPVNGTEGRMAPRLPTVAGQQINWADKGAVTPIKNQGQCGSCWTFSATGNMEGQWFLAGNTLVGLSEEEIVECSHNHQDGGCAGGYAVGAFEWVIKNGGINSEAAYPYTSGFGRNGRCKRDKTKTHVAHIKSYSSLPQDEDQMASYTFTHGPISIAVDAVNWNSYGGGIMSHCPHSQLDHAVLIVGFDDNHSPPYWVVKNSWGTSWGENGFVRIKKGSNECGLKDSPSTSHV